MLSTIFITGAPHWAPVLSHGYLLSQLFVQGSHEKETILAGFFNSETLFSTQE